MEEQERNARKTCEFQQPDFRAAENVSLDKSTTPSESGAESNSSTGSAHTQSVVIFDPNGQPLQCESMVIGQSENGELYVIRSNRLGGAQILLHKDQLQDSDSTATCIGKPPKEEKLTVDETATDCGTNALPTEAPPSFTDAKVHFKSSPEEFVPSLKPLTAAVPNWAKRLRSCEKLGDSYRGYCNTEAELEVLLLLHKQQTQCVFGTRQSPSPAKPATRLMWKSQYVPYDGIPFVNAGSRAIVMECQFGPRRKGTQTKKVPVQETCHNVDYKATCPARIYIKKVRKFPEYKVPVDPKVDKKVVRQEQEKAFFNLKKKLWDTGGVIRYYIQLPTQKAHLYHDVDTIILPPLPEQPGLLKEEEEEEEEEEMIGSEGAEEEQDAEAQGGGPVLSRLHPLVAEKIHALVAQGCSQVYNVRKQLRKFVEREMFKSDPVPERHNLCYFPTVNDIKNHIHEAQKALQLSDGVLASPDTEWKSETENFLTETVTLTLTPASINVHSPKEGLLEGGDTLCPEAVQFFGSLTSLQPKIFAQLQGIQLQSATCPTEGSLAPQPISATEPLEPSNPLHPQAVFLSPASFLQSSPSGGETVSLPEPPAMLGMGQLVSISTMEAGPTETGVTQILLEDGRTIPVQIVDSSGLALRASVEEVLVKEGSEAKHGDISAAPPRD
ncbi:calcium-responsive transcription factor isoform X2 [Brachyhypopomus gauderio]|uniref:calcium-responsive transcription factor isoform X2 n=1 Tax=Brachyhypopomus gauderio TaxID=698409 RepID=UPI004042C8C1